MNKLKLIFTVLMCFFVLIGCFGGNSKEEASEDKSAWNIKPGDVFESDGFRTEFKNYDTNDEWGNSAVKIELSDENTKILGEGAVFNEKVLNIVKGGTYVLSGNLSDGQIKVSVSDEEKVQLVLNGASVKSFNSSAIFVENADKVSITLAEGTENEFSDGAAYTLEPNTDEPNACIFSKDDLSFNGKGTLNVKGNFKNGITSKDDLKIVDGNINVIAANDAIKGKDSVVIGGGSINIEAGKDGIEASEDNKEDKGFLFIIDGNINIKALKGLDSVKAVIIQGGNINLDVKEEKIICDGVVNIAEGAIKGGY